MKPVKFLSFLVLAGAFSASAYAEIQYAWTPVSKDLEVESDKGKCTIQRGGSFKNTGKYVWESNYTLQYRRLNEADGNQCATGVVFYKPAKFIADEKAANEAARRALPGFEYAQDQYLYFMKYLTEAERYEINIARSRVKVSTIQSGRDGISPRCDLMEGAKIKVLALLQKDFYGVYTAPSADSPGCRTGAFVLLNFHELSRATSPEFKIDRAHAQLELPKYTQEVEALVKQNAGKAEVRFQHGVEGYVEMAGSNLPKEFIREQYRHHTTEFYKAYICDRREEDSASLIGELPDGKALFRYHREPEAGDEVEDVCPEGTLFIEAQNYLDRNHQVDQARAEKKAKIEFLKSVLEGRSNLKTMGRYEVGARKDIHHTASVVGLKLKDGSLAESICRVQAGNSSEILGFDEKRNTILLRYIYQPQDLSDRPVNGACPNKSLFEIPNR